MNNTEKIYKEFYSNKNTNIEKHTKKYLAEKKYEVEIIWHNVNTGEEENDFMFIYAKDMKDLKRKMFDLFDLKYKISKLLGRINSINEFL